MNHDEHESRRLRWDHCFNARDLGGYPTAKGRATRRGVFVRTDNLSRLTPSGQTALREYGVRTVIDLRTELERANHPVPFARPEDETVRYLHLPFFLEAEVTNPLIPEASPADLQYCYRLDQVPHRVGEILRTMADTPEGAILFHCHSGKDRTGMLAVILLLLAGVPDALIAEDYALSSEYLRPADQAWIDEQPELSEQRRQEIEQWRTRPERALAIVRHLRERYGGVEGYLRQAGLSEEQIERLRRKLVG